MPPLAISNQPGFWPLGAAEGPLLVAEQLALDERLGQRADVGGDERPVAAAARSWMARAISSLPVPLSPSIITVTSVSAIWAIWPSSSVIAALWPTISGSALAAPGQAVAEPAVLLPQPVVLEGVADLEPQHRQVHRLGDVVVRRPAASPRRPSRSSRGR